MAHPTAAQSAALIAMEPGAAARSDAAEAPVLVYEQCGPWVVSITSVPAIPTAYGAQPSQAVGSGFIIDTDGRIVTNNHSVQAADQLRVTFQDGTTTRAALLGRDPDNDLAVIAVDPTATDDTGTPIASLLRPVRYGESDAVRIGEQAIAIGSPMVCSRYLLLA